MRIKGKRFFEVDEIRSSYMGMALDRTDEQTVFIESNNLKSGRRPDFCRMCRVKKILTFLKKEMMLTVSLVAALIALILTPPGPELLQKIDWRTLGTLFMMLCVLEGFKSEDVLRPVVSLASNLKRMTTLSLFLIFGVFFASMFVTNDVSLIIFVPLTILLFRAGGKEHYILPVISMENIAAIRGSLLMPFGSPQNLFLFQQSGVSADALFCICHPCA